MRSECLVPPQPHGHVRQHASTLEILLLIYSCVVTYLYAQSSRADCNLLAARALTSVHMNDISSDDGYVQQHVIGKDNFPSSSVTIPDIFSNGFKKKSLCKNVNQTFCEFKDFKHSKHLNTLHGDQVLYSRRQLGQQPISVDQICQGFNYMFEYSAAFTYPNFLGVSLQQDPNDAFAIMDLIWRLKPDVLIELGTNGGGSAFFYAFIMRAYNPRAKVITIDPMRTTDWNLQNVELICPHCIDARDTALWKNTDTITFFNQMPVDTVDKIHGLIKKWGSKTVMVIEDSNHMTKTVSENLNNFATFVTPGSYLIVQDTKMRRLGFGRTVDPQLAAEDFLVSEAGKDFKVDRSYEYYHCTQHAKGFLQKSK